ncbi:MAG: L,D-transpeptidase [Candidatus Eisenbacteria bacterium]
MKTFVSSRMRSFLLRGRNRDPSAARRRWHVAAFAAAALVLAGLAALFAGTGFEYEEASASPAGSPPASSDTPQRSALESERARVIAKLRRAAPKEKYIVIDRTHNRLSLLDGDRVLFSAICSCGSGIAFSHGERRWIFDTPQGVFRIQQLQSNPVWRKPDWAFLEEGKAVPSDPSERFDNAALGEYALHFGRGYMIHGTLYERLLGRSVTHGCIRLGRDDLRNVWRAVHVGTPIYIF